MWLWPAYRNRAPLTADTGRWSWGGAEASDLVGGQQVRSAFATPVACWPTTHLGKQRQQALTVSVVLDDDMSVGQLARPNPQDLILKTQDVLAVRVVQCQQGGFADVP